MAEKHKRWVFKLVRFEHREVAAAKAHSAAGGIALHVWNPGPQGWPGAPACFMKEAKAGRPWAHLLDQNLDRLLALGRKLGVSASALDKKGQPDQHLDLCAGPLRKAMAMAETRAADEQPALALATESEAL